MSRPAGATRRSGDPRKRAAQTPAPRPDTGTRRRVVVAVVAAVGLALLVFLLLRPADQEENAGLEHAEVACDYTSKAEEAADVETDERFAAAVLLLDQAIIASARAADSNTAFADLDDAVQAVHTAGHGGDPEEWQAALNTALDTCRTAID